MHCEQCGVAHKGSQRLCPECQRILNGVSAPRAFNSGDGVDGAFPNPDRGASVVNESIELKVGRRRPGGIERVEVIPAKYKGRPATTAEFRKHGTAGTVLAIFGFVVIAHSAWWLVLLIPSLFAMKVGWALKHKRFYRFASLFTVEANKSGHIFLTRIGGECPECMGELELKDYGVGKWRKTMIQCNHDPNHKWGFISDVLGDL